MMKILQCIPSLEGGGAERQFCYLNKALGDEGVQVRSVSLRGGANLELLRKSGAEYTAIEHLSNLDPMVAWRLRKIILRCQPDIVQTWLPQMDVMGGVAALLAGVPLVVSERTSSEGYVSGWRTAVRLAVGGRADAIVANSEGGANYWRNESRKSLVHVIPNAIPFQEIEAATPVPDSAITSKPFVELILFLGRMHPVKNLANLLPALKKVLETRTHAAGALLGNGPLFNEASHTVRMWELEDRLRVMPFTQDPYAWLARANVFVSVSDHEGNPNTVLEAVAAGCPVVVSDIPAHREFLDDHSAKFVCGQSCDSITSGILDVLQNPLAASDRARHAKERVLSRSSGAVGQQYLEVYEEILRRRRRAP